MNAPEPGNRGESPAARLDALLPPEMAERAEEIGVRKAALDLPRLFTLAVLAGAFIALGGVFATTALAGADRILAIVPPITAFVAAGFEHSIANMYFVPYAMFVAAIDPDFVAGRGLGTRRRRSRGLPFSAATCCR
jgi:formate/nitrite transporter FocA (FNT family)